jgi:hypothetical protein
MILMKKPKSTFTANATIHVSVRASFEVWGMLFFDFAIAVAAGLRIFEHIIILHKKQQYSRSRYWYQYISMYTCSSTESPPRHFQFGPPL